ncbi:MAG: TlpA family protein disulfide reductase [Phycisphaerales bacterium]|nr:MAG: TlpA family protein disulfide reductase [Phycisphaerales bacterium]
MDMHYRRLLGLLTFALLSPIAHGQFGAAPRLKVGDMAPPLAIAEWVKGEPVDLAAGKGKHVFVVEFWATWCGPCQYSIPELTELQKVYGDKGLKVIGVTSPDLRGNTLKAVKRYVEERNDTMAYTVAFDDQTKTNDAWMMAANQYGIPTAFIVDRSGKIAWIGPPLVPEFTEIVGQVVDNVFDPQRQERIRNLSDALVEKAQGGDLRASIEIATQILELDPGYQWAIQAVYTIYVEQLEDVAGLREWAGKFIAKNRGHSRAMTRLSTQLMGTGMLPNRLPDLALDAARAAYEGTQRKDAEAAAVYARALYQIGAIDEAIKTQELAVSLTSASMADDHRALLAFYQDCKKARNTLASP